MIISSLISILSFIALYLPYSLLHQNKIIEDYGLVILILSFILLPTVHHFMHAVPLLLWKKNCKKDFRWEFGFWPNVVFIPSEGISKGLAIFSTIAPTLFISLPGLIAGALFPNQYPYFLIFTALNIGISYKDFICLRYLIKAPKKSVIENNKDEFDILVQL